MAVVTHHGHTQIMSSAVLRGMLAFIEWIQYNGRTIHTAILLSHACSYSVLDRLYSLTDRALVTLHFFFST